MGSMANSEAHEGKGALDGAESSRRRGKGGWGVPKSHRRAVGGQAVGPGGGTAGSWPHPPSSWENGDRNLLKRHHLLKHPGFSPGTALGERPQGTGWDRSPSAPTKTPQRSPFLPPPAAPASATHHRHTPPPPLGPPIALIPQDPKKHHFPHYIPHPCRLLQHQPCSAHRHRGHRHVPRSRGMPTCSGPYAGDSAWTLYGPGDSCGAHSPAVT